MKGHQKLGVLLDAGPILGAMPLPSAWQKHDSVWNR